MCLHRRARALMFTASSAGLLALLLAGAAPAETVPGRLAQFPGTIEPPLARPLPSAPAPPPIPVPVVPAPQAVGPFVPAPPPPPQCIPAPPPPPPQCIPAPALPPPLPVAPALPPLPVAPPPPAPVILSPPPPPPVVVAPVVRPAPSDPPVPVVAIRVRVTDCAHEGQEVKYLICVDNSAPAAAHHVLIRAALPAGAHLARAEPPPSTQDGELLWALGTLPGQCNKEIWLVLVPTGSDDLKFCARVQFEHGECVCTRVARSAPPAVPPTAPSAGGAVMPYAEQQPTRPGQPGREPTQPDKEPTPPEKSAPKAKGEARLDVKITGPKQQLVNQPASYTITLRNPGTGAAGNTLLTATFPGQLEFVSASAGGRHVLNQVAWLPGTLEAGASRTVDVVLKAKAPRELCVQAAALADPNLTAKDEVCTTFKGASAARLKMVDTKDPIAVGEETSYTIEVLSQGSLPLTNVRIKAIIPPEMELVKATGPTDNRKGAAVKDGQELLFDPYPSLAPAAALTYEVFARGLKPGDARFRIVLTADQLQAGGPVREEESTMIFQDVARALEVRRLKGRGQ